MSGKVKITAALFAGAFVIANAAFAGTSREVPFTQEDRDRIIRLEEGQKHLQQQIGDMRTTTQQQIGDLRTTTQQQISDLKSDMREIKEFMLWGFGVLFAGMFALIGFVIWDRRTALSPVQRRQGQVEEEQENIKKALREYAREEPKLASILKTFRLL